jgi:predicted DNA-binding transcriptional regulator YafY
MSRRLERLLKIDTLLRSGYRQTADGMAADLEVTERTVRADIEFLRDRYSAPIEWNKHQGYHYTDPDWRLPTIPLTQGELFALTLGANMLEAYAGSAYQADLKAAIARLAERLPEQNWIDLQQLAQENVMFRCGAELNLDPQIWHILEQACQKRRRVKMVYGTPGKEVSEREFDAYVLHFARNNPYVTGWCHSRQMVRDFRVDRIRSLDLLKQTFEVSESFDRKAHFGRMFQHEVGGVTQSIVIWFDGRSAPYIRERRWHPTQSLEEHPDGAVTLRMEVPGLNEVKRWVLFYGAGARVLGPPDLVEMVRSELAGMNELYGEAGV